MVVEIKNRERITSYIVVSLFSEPVKPVKHYLYYLYQRCFMGNHKFSMLVKNVDYY